MNLLKSFWDLFAKIFDYFANILIPEKTQIRRILSINEADLFILLPKSKFKSKDIIVLFDYQNDTVKNLVKSFKYKNNRKVKERLAKYLYDEILEYLSDISIFYGNKPILIPMPMSNKERKERGFNQCEEMVNELEKIGNKNFEVRQNLLFKIKETERQTKLKKEARMINVNHCMNVNHKIDLENRVIIVFDDVFTTLSTYNEACRALNQAKPKKIVGLFIAH